MERVKIIGEIGINHNGDIELAKKLILVAKAAGCDYVKFQKRTPSICVPEGMKRQTKNTPWGVMSYLEYKEKIEFEWKEYEEINNYCAMLGIPWFASVWDKTSVEFIKAIQMRTTKPIMKIPSALITDLELCKYAREKTGLLIISTGMSTEEDIEKCVNACNPDVIMHTNSTYPCPVNELNLNYITHLKKKYPDKQIGYSGHEYGLVTTFATIPMGATWIERHITLDRTMWGSDHAASIEPSGLIKLVKGIRDIENSLLIAEAPRVIFGGEEEKLKSLRK